MSRSRRLLMVAFVAAALCADRAATAAPVLRPQVVQTARRLAGRLVVSFRHTVPAMRLDVQRCDQQPPRSGSPCIAEAGQSIHHLLLSPFQFRLPPPVV